MEALQENPIASLSTKQRKILEGEFEDFSKRFTVKPDNAGYTLSEFFYSGVEDFLSGAKEPQIGDMSHLHRHLTTARIAGFNAMGMLINSQNYNHLLV